jgi:hypothetical protein
MRSALPDRRRRKARPRSKTGAVEQRSLNAGSLRGCSRGGLTGAEVDRGASRERALDALARATIATTTTFAEETDMTYAALRVFSILFLLIAGAAQAAASPCVTASPDCVRWVTPGESAKRLLVYSTHALDVRNAAIGRALVTIHGGNRNADDYFRSVLAAGFLAGALDDTVVIAPRFASNGGDCQDPLAEGEFNWPRRGNSWQLGGSAENAALTSYDLVDQILQELARKDIFPNLKTIVVAGHSAGGGFVTRYEMANWVHDKLAVPVTYVVANSNSYTYLDPDRPTEKRGRIPSVPGSRELHHLRPLAFRSP